MEKTPSNSNSRSKTITKVLQKCNFLLNGYIVDEDNKLGEGSFGAVYPAKSKNNGLIYAIKILYPEFDSFSEMINEILILSHLNHSHIIQTIETYMNAKENQAIIIMELADKSLSKLLREKGGSLEKPYVLQILADILTGLNYAHNEKTISHSDIKPANILVFTDIDRNLLPTAQKLFVKEPKHIFKLADWGGGKLAGKRIDRTMTRFSNMEFTEAYAAPEILKQEGNLKINLAKADIYSIGLCILNCCGVKSEEFKYLNFIVKKEKHRQEMECLLKENKVEENYGGKVCALLQQMVSYESKERLEIYAIFEKLKEIIEIETNENQYNQNTIIKKEVKLNQNQIVEKKQSSLN